MTNLIGPSPDSEFIKKPAAKDVKEFHVNSDVDSSRQAHHHTLGDGHNQAAPGRSTADKIAVLTAKMDASDPAGRVELWPLDASTVPDGWKPLDGSADLLPSGTYPVLEALLGTTTLPDWRDRVPVGASGTKAAGTTGGADTVTLGPNNLPPHNHSINHDHTVPMQYSPDVPTTGTAVRVIRINGKGASGSGGTSDPFTVPTFTGNSGNNTTTNDPVNIQNKYVAGVFMIRAY